jgi:Aerotolerance regulator N-terminal
MAFLAPIFFAALAAAAIPILIHLTQRERKQVIEFPSLMFLEKIPYQSVRRRRIRDWPLLAMRLAALLLIVLAFARPFFDRPIAALASAAGPREVVILLDRSYSMGYGDR